MRVRAASPASHLVGKSARSIARARACFLEIMEEGVRARAIAGDTRVLARFFAGGLRSFSLGAIQDGDTDLRRHAGLGLTHAILTGTRCTTFTKLPDALSGGSSEKRDPVPGARPRARARSAPS